MVSCKSCGAAMVRAFKYKDSSSVEVISRGWRCPNCNHYYPDEEVKKVTICKCCGTETDMRKYSDREAIQTLVKMGKASTYDRMRKWLIINNLRPRDVLKRALRDNDHWWLRK